MMAANLKESLHTLADQLPDNATWEDVMVDVGIQAAERGEFATQEEVRAAFARWGVNIVS